jgi:murein DD-endopeptidase MepM/ murein hydrolase activator NlpD
MMEGLADMASWWVDILTEQSINVSVVFVLVLLATRVPRRLGPSLPLVLWGMVFVRLLLPPGLSHPWSAGALVHKVLPHDPPSGTHGVGGMGNPIVGLTGEKDILPLDSTASRLPVALGAFWMLGVGTVLMIYRRRLALFHERARVAIPSADPAVHELSERWRRRLQVRRRVRVVTSSARIAPFTLGVLRPIIFIPMSIIDDRRLLEPVVAHEMAHVARWDAVWLGLQHFLQAVYFFHPLVWIAGARLDAERERLCDATVVSAGWVPARDYAGSLVGVLRLGLSGGEALTMTARKRRIGMRIQDILGRDGVRRPRLAAAIATAMLLGVVFLPLGAGGTDAETAGAIGSDMSTKPTTPERGGTDFESPLPGGRVTWRWGNGLDPWTKEKVFHRGIDVAAEMGTEVVAPADGKVIEATENFEESPASGTVIVIDHGGGWTTFYAHLGSLEVRKGQTVSQRDVIAKIGSTGKSTGPHLHFEIRHDGEQLNPAEFVSDWK